MQCDPRAFAVFTAQLGRLDTTEGLVRAAVAVSMHAFDDIDPTRVEGQLDDLAERVRKRVKRREAKAYLAHLHEVLFNEAGFHGSQERYYSPLNSCLPYVLEAREGIPITLSLVYKAVAERLGFSVRGINTPGHFLVEVDGDRPLLVDPFHQGRVLSRGEAGKLIRQICGARTPLSLSYASHRQWLSRLIGNLQYVLSLSQRSIDLAAMNDLQSALQAS